MFRSDYKPFSVICSICKVPKVAIKSGNFFIPGLEKSGNFILFLKTRGCSTGQLFGQLSSLSSRTKWQRLPAGDTLCSVWPADNRCHFVLLDNDESCPTADLYNTGRPNGPAYSTGELLN